MSPLSRFMDVLALGPAKPIRRLAVYYALLAIAVFLVFRFSPYISGLLTGDDMQRLLQATPTLKNGVPPADAASQVPPHAVTSLAFGLSTALEFLSTLLLMLPVAWVYMSTSPGRRHNQSLVQTLILLPLVVAGIVLVVQNSLALAFSLTGVVAAVRFRTNLSEARDVVLVFLAIAVGFACGVHLIVAAAYLSVIFNLVLVWIWRYDFGRNVIDANASSEWVAPLATLAERTNNGYSVPDRDLVLALTPKKVDVLSHRFERIRKRIGSNGKKPKYNAVVTVTTNDIGDAQRASQKALNHATKRWKLDEIVTNSGKPSELYYMVRTRKAFPRDALLTEIRQCGDGCIASVDIEVGDAIALEQSQLHAQKKQEQTKALELA